MLTNCVLLLFIFLMILIFIRFSEIEELGSKLMGTHPEIKSQTQQLSEARMIVRDLWEEKYAWISQSLDLQIFDREANQLQSICANQNKLLNVADLGVSFG